MGKFPGRMSSHFWWANVWRVNLASLTLLYFHKGPTPKASARLAWDTIVSAWMLLCKGEQRRKARELKWWWHLSSIYYSSNYFRNIKRERLLILSKSALFPPVSECAFLIKRIKIVAINNHCRYFERICFGIHTILEHEVKDIINR